MAQTTLTSNAPAPLNRLPPGARGHWLWGSLPALQRDMLGLYRDTARQYGDVARLRFVNVDTFALSHPDHFRHVLQDNNRNYVRNPFFNDIVRLFIGQSLFTTDGDDWLSRRRLMQPAFHRQRIAAFGELMTGAATAMLARWDSGPDGQRLDIDQEMMALTLRVAGQALFSVDLLGQASTLGEGFAGMSEYVNYRLGHPYQLPAFIPTRANRLLKRSKQILDKQVYELIRARRKSGEDHADLLGLLMAARDADTGEGMSDLQLHNEIMVMMFAGHETTAVTLTWAFYLLSEHPEAEARLVEELRSVLGGRVPTVADLPHLPYTRRVIDETLRMYPPAFGITRQSVDADEIGGYHIPAQASVTLLTNNAHHDPRFWDQPDAFDPDRFTPERSANRPPLAYLPFGAGPRQCIGNQFALTEAQLVLATIAQRYQLRLVPGHPVRPRPVFVLRTSDGLPMTLVRR